MEEEELTPKEIDKLISLVKQEMEFIQEKVDTLTTEDMGRLIIKGLKAGEESPELKELIHSSPETASMYKQLKVLQMISPKTFEKSVIAAVKDVDKNELVDTKLLVVIHDKLHLMKSR